MRYGLAAAAAVMFLTAGAAAEPTGRWFSAVAQGVTEYGVKNDNAGSDYFYIACQAEGAAIMVTVGGATPQPMSTLVVAIDDDEYQLGTDATGDIGTVSRAGHDSFLALWESLRDGDVMRVRLSTGQSSVFSLAGTAKVLPRRHCRTGFER